jgi:hypothetical protein
MRLGDWPFPENDLRPFAEELAKEFNPARAELRDRGGAIDDFSGLDGWEQFRRGTPDLPEIRGDRAWEHVFEEKSLQRAGKRHDGRRPSCPTRSGLPRWPS